MNPTLEHRVAERTGRLQSEVRGDPLLPGQVFQSLHSPAAWFVDIDVRPRIRITAERRGDQGIFSVIDNEIGIPRESVPRLFRVFGRLGDGQEDPGTGIGPAIVCCALERMSGEGGVPSEPGKGSRFRIRLLAAGVGRRESMILAPGILLVEDDASDVLFLKRAFRKTGSGIPIHSVENGLLAIEYLSGEGPFADRATYPQPTHILLDLKLPIRSGFEVLEWIRAEPVLQTLRICVLTSSKEPRDLRRARDLGVNCYLVKPMGFTALVEVAQAIDGWVRSGRIPPASQSLNEGTFEAPP